MEEPEVSRVFNKHKTYSDQTLTISISIAANGGLNYVASGYSLLPRQWDIRLIKTSTKVISIQNIGSYPKAYLSWFVEEALNDTLKKILAK